MIRELAAYLELVVVLLAGGVIYPKPELAPWPLIVAPLLWIARQALQGLRGWRNHFLTGLDGLVILFQLSAGLALWATYDRSLGLTIFGPGGDYKFWLICAGAIIYFAVARLPGRRAVWLVMAGFGVFGVLVALYFLLTRDFSTGAVKFPFITELGLLIQTLMPRVDPLTAGRQMHPNVAGGLAAMFFPPMLQIALSGWRRLPNQRLGWLALAGSLLGLLILAMGIVLSSSRGAWIGLGCALGGWLCWILLDKFLGKRGMARASSLRLRALLLSTLGLVALPMALLLMMWVISRPEGGAGAEGSLFGRLELLQNSLLLVQAAPFTGTGLGTFPMVYSTYVLLIHVPFTSHAHNIFMNILLSQGWPGLLLFLGILLASLVLAYRLAQRAPGRWPLAGMLAMLAVSMVHGFVDDPLYGSRAVLIWLVPAGLIAAAARNEGPGLAPCLATRTSRMAALVSGLVVLALALVFSRELLAAFQANLGLVEQAKIELAQYDSDHFTERTLEQIRREEDYSDPEAYFASALQYQAGQLAAGQRLADLAMSQQRYAAALAYIEPQWAAGQHDRVTRLLYGSALVANGQPQAAYAQVQGLPWAKERLSYEAWYRYYLSHDYRRAADAYRVVLLIDPGNESARDGLAAAQKKIP